MRPSKPLTRYEDSSTRARLSKHLPHPSSKDGRDSSSQSPLWVNVIVVAPSASTKSTSISCSTPSSSSCQTQVKASRLGGSISVYRPPPPYLTSSCGFRIRTRTSPPTRRSTVASGVSQSCPACHQRRITSSLVNASKTACADASNVRFIRTFAFAAPTAPSDAFDGPPLPIRARRAARRRRRRAPARAPPPARPRCGRSRAVRVVVVPPPVGRRLGPALRRVLPLLLAAEGAQVEVTPGCAHGLVAAGVDEVRAVDAVALADERVMP